MSTVDCPAGTYASVEGGCIFCPRGTYQDLTHQAECKQCPLGTFTKQDGSKSVTDCICKINIFFFFSPLSFFYYLEYSIVYYTALNS